MHDPSELNKPNTITQYKKKNAVTGQYNRQLCHAIQCQTIQPNTLQDNTMREIIQLTARQYSKYTNKKTTRNTGRRTKKQINKITYIHHLVTLCLQLVEF